VVVTEELLAQPAKAHCTPECTKSTRDLEQGAKDARHPPMLQAKESLLPCVPTFSLFGT